MDNALGAAAAAAYLEAQLEVAIAVREAHDSGVTATELDASWLGIPPEEAVIQARIEASQEDAHAEQRYPGIAAHLRACGPCGEDFDGPLATVCGETH